jgi:hypothetical protein
LRIKENIFDLMNDLIAKEMLAECTNKYSLIKNDIEFISSELGRIDKIDSWAFSYGNLFSPLLFSDEASGMTPARRLKKNIIHHGKLEKKE